MDAQVHLRRGQLERGSEHSDGPADVEGTGLRGCPDEEVWDCEWRKRGRMGDPVDIEMRGEECDEESY